MRVLIKLGGTLLDSPASRERIAAQIARAFGGDRKLVVVHGGGKQMTRFLSERGVESRFVNGLRVTSPETLDAVVKVLAGSVNHELVAALVRAGLAAVGLSGIDASLVEAEQMSAELGAVGRVVRANPALLELLAGNGYLPVVACLGGDRSGNLYNVNADQMAVACGAAFGCDELVFLTDVEGVLDGNRRLLARLTVPESRRLIESGVASGGMEAKLNAAASALERGVRRVRILPGASERVLERLFAGEPLGTSLMQEEVAAHD
jgi:acetylglutamate kinase